MSTLPVIDQITGVPQIGQTPTEFAAQADLLAAQLPGLVSDLNAFGVSLPTFLNNYVGTLDQLIAFNAMAAGQGTGKTRMFLTGSGLPTYYVGFPKSTWSELRPDGALGSAVHQAFMDGTTEKDMRWIAKYPLSLAASGEVVSQPGTKPYVSRTLDEEIAICAGTTIIGADSGTHHQMSIWDWSLVYYWMQVNDYEPIGNTSYGKSHEKTWIKGDGTTTVNAGSMGAETHHDGTNEGVDLLVGNVWDRLARMYLDEGQVLLQADNGGAPSQAACTAESFWFSSSNPALTSGYSTPSIVSSAAAQNQNSGSAYDHIAGASGFSSVAGPSSVLLKQACLEPMGDSTDLKGGIWARSHGLRAPLRGGAWNIASSAGAAALSLSNEPTARSSTIGFRAAFST